MGMRNYIKTMGDLERYHYSDAGQNYINIQKDAPVITTTAGVYNAVYGAQVWAQLNQEANAFGLMPKYVWTHSGWRVITTAAGSTADGGIAEDGDIPATIKPTFAEVSTKPKTVAHAFDVSEIQEFEADLSEDDAFGSMAQMRTIMAVKHKEAINEMLLEDVNTTADDAFESIDRVCSSYTEVTDNSLGANDADIYGLDRDTSTGWYHAYLDGNSGTARVLTDSMLRSAIDNIGEVSGNTTLILTGYDTYAAIQGLYDSQVRYNVLQATKAKIGINGVETADGIDTGINVTSLYGIPLFRSSDVTKDTISRVYFLDTSDPEGHGKPRLGMKIAKPTQYFETGMNVGDPFAINKFNSEGVYRTVAELICFNFKSQGKIRDLK